MLVSLITLLSPQPRVRTARVPASSMCAAVDHFGYDFISQQAPASVLAALRDGQKTQAVEAFTPNDEETEETSVPAIGVALECIHALADEVDGSLLLLLPTFSAVASASAMVAEWPQDMRDRLQINTLLHQGGPAFLEETGSTGSTGSTGETIGAVVLCEVSFDDGSGMETQLLRDARAWLRMGGAAAALCVNAHVPMLRFESDLVTHSFSLVPYAIRRELLRYEALRTVGGFLSERICASARCACLEPSPHHC